MLRVHKRQTRVGTEHHMHGGRVRSVSRIVSHALGNSLCSLHFSVPFICRLVTLVLRSAGNHREGPGPRLNIELTVVSYM